MTHGRQMLASSWPQNLRPHWDGPSPTKKRRHTHDKAEVILDPSSLEWILCMGRETPGHMWVNAGTTVRGHTPHQYAFHKQQNQRQ